MKNDDKASVSIKKVISISIILLFIMEMVVMAASSKINKVKIILSDGSEMSVLTSKTKVSEILSENHVVLLPVEKSIPDYSEDISDNNTIRIQKNALSFETSERVNSSNLTVEHIMENYNEVNEKIIKEQVSVAYETEVKDLSTGSGDKEEILIQNGINGLKEISYKVKYINGKEVSRIKITENIVKDPVKCVKHIKDKKVVTSRSSTVANLNAAANGASLASKVQGITPTVKTLNTSAYCAASCGGNSRTACGAAASPWYTVAAGSAYPIGTIIYVPSMANKPNGGWFVVQDRGGAISNSKLDIYMSSYSECTTFGRKNLECYIYVF